MFALRSKMQEAVVQRTVFKKQSDFMNPTLATTVGWQEHVYMRGICCGVVGQFATPLVCATLLCRGQGRGSLDKNSGRGIGLRSLLMASCTAAQDVIKISTGRHGITNSTTGINKNAFAE